MGEVDHFTQQMVQIVVMLPMNKEMYDLESLSEMVSLSVVEVKEVQPVLLDELGFIRLTVHDKH